MARIRLSEPLTINLRGYDREPSTLEAGEHEVPERVAAWLRANPGHGEVLDADDEPSGGAEPAPAAALLEGSVRDAIERIRAADEPGLLTEARGLEGGGDGGGRVTVLNAIERRLEALSGEEQE